MISMATRSPEELEYKLQKIAQKHEFLTFHVHDQKYTVPTQTLSPSTSLNTYIRTNLHMTGTKGMCFEGGCGCCVAVIQIQDPITGKQVLLSVNTCLMPVLACSNAKIYTCEGIGNPLVGYHAVQKVLASFNGTQCGFCSPGMVMNMYSLYESGKLTMQKIEDAFSGNICRCTGYRPILAAFKSLASDATVEAVGEHHIDIEDLKSCSRTEDLDDWVEVFLPTYYILNDDSKWVKLYTVRDLYSTIRTHGASGYKLVAGNTAQGVYPAYGNDANLYIDVTSIPDLLENREGNNCYIFGANMTLTNTIEAFKQIAGKNTNYSYFTDFAQHLDLVANLPVRNRGTLAGNLMIKHDHHEFPSDVFLLLETVGALITIGCAKTGIQVKMVPSDFINYDMTGNVMLNFCFPAFSSSYKIVTYKIMTRAQNVHAIVNAGFLFKFKTQQSLDSCSIIYGNITTNFNHATQTEALLKGKNLFDNKTLQSCYQTLSSEVNPDSRPPDPSPECRKKLALALFYKVVLSLSPSVTDRNKSGGVVLERPLSSGSQDYETNQSLYPLTQAIPKIEALAQTSGQAKYIKDMPDLPYQLFGVLVLAKTAPSAKIRNIDASKALATHGVVAFYTKDDIPGDNNFTPIMTYFSAPEEIFCSGTVLYYDQPIGILVGDDEKVVTAAVELIHIAYDAPTQKPALSTPQILRENRKDRIVVNKTVDPKSKGGNTKHVVKGDFNIYQQYHFYMETICCAVIPTEDIMEVYASTQYMDVCQIAIAKMLKIRSNQILVICRRCGGGFGGKVSRTHLVSCAAALAAWKLRQPVKVSLPLKTNMRALGKRFPLSTTYEAGVDDNGVIQYLNCSLYTDVGCVQNEDSTFWVKDGVVATYNSDTFKLQFNKVRTDTATNTWARAPGSAEGIAFMETLMDNISFVLDKDPISVRVANLRTDSPLHGYFDDINSWANISTRMQDVEKFNSTNRWKKRGLSVTPMVFNFDMDGPFFAMVTIFHDDGSVQLCHSGVEIGQGINTKAVQVCAWKLGIPLDSVMVVPSNTFAAANGTATGDNKTSEAVCFGILQACDVLLDRIKPYRDQLPTTATWQQIISKCQDNFVNLTANGVYAPNQKGVNTYPIYGICATEILLDVLTGQHYIIRTDLIEDAGISSSPVIDIGQIEGAFIMGLGYHVLEKTVFDADGQLLTDNTWRYHPPGAKDIPVDFRVKMPKNNPNSLGVLKSKGTGEPALCLSISVALAIRHAVASARRDAGAANPKWYPLDGPTDVESVIMNTLNDPTQYTL